MPPSFAVTGGRPLKGTIRPAGNKNAALPILAATLVADGLCRIDNVPHIGDVETMLELLAHLGAAVQWTGPNRDRKSTRLNSSHSQISYAVFCLKKNKAWRRGWVMRALLAASDGHGSRALPRQAGLAAGERPLARSGPRSGALPSRLRRECTAPA